MAYVCGVGALALIAADLFSGAAIDTVEMAVPLRSRDAWAAAVRPQPAFAAPVADFSSQSESYEIFRHPQGGGRKDILRWSAAASEAPLSQIELYRPGTELTAFGPAASEIAARVGAGPYRGNPGRRRDRNQIRPRRAGRLCRAMSAASRSPASASRTVSKRHGCRSAAGPARADSAQAQRQAVGCALDRLTMLSAGNDPKLAELFARAELRRAGCSHAAPASSDWVTATHEPVLRGRL